MRAMAESATQTVTIAASPEHCFAVATDFARYPEWAKDIKEAVIREVDDLGRATTVEFRASALGRSTHYTLAYDYSAAPEKLSWQLVHGDITRAIDGAYTFTPSVTEPGSTDVLYDLSIELVVPLPGFVKRRAEVRILNTVKELKARAEAYR
jgi:Polyketide cyclase / dehydrase and lipid transport